MSKTLSKKGRVIFAYFWLPKLALHSLSTELANLELANFHNFYEMYLWLFDCFASIHLFFLF